MGFHARVLGVAQDAGVPHIGCACARCVAHVSEPLRPACLGIVGRRTYVIDATPAFAEQVRELPRFPSAILLTHVHMGHIAGLLQLGEEAYAARGLKVFAQPRTVRFLKDNAPWNRLDLEFSSENPIELEPGLAVEALPVEHRGLETVGYFVRGPNRTLLYLPDIDGWGDDLSAWLARCDVALLDGTFYSAAELPRQAAIPHPPIEATLARLSPAEARKVRFIHINHTNPVLDPDGPRVSLAYQGDELAL